MCACMRVVIKCLTCFAYFIFYCQATAQRYRGINFVCCSLSGVTWNAFRACTQPHTANIAHMLTLIINICMCVFTDEMNCAVACHCATIVHKTRQAKALRLLHTYTHELPHMAMLCITLVGLSKLVFVYFFLEHFRSARFGCTYKWQQHTCCAAAINIGVHVHFSVCVCASSAVYVCYTDPVFWFASRFLVTAGDCHSYLTRFALLLLFLLLALALASFGLASLLSAGFALAANATSACRHLYFTLRRFFGRQTHFV